MRAFCECDKKNVPGVLYAWCGRCSKLPIKPLKIEQINTIKAVDCGENNDSVNHPKHYTSHPSGVECITITRHHNFAIGNAIKYLFRAGLKHPSPVEDLKKAIWYIEDEIKRIEK